MALTFNSTYYYSQRPDVLEAYLNSGFTVSAFEFALNHYNNFGWKEGSNPNPVFITSEYLTENQDVAAAGVNPFQHYQMYGQAEGRAPNATFPSLAEFDWETYVAANPDLGAAGINTAAEAYDHYITFGYAEGRPGAPDNSDFQLVQAVSAYQDAQEANATFLAEADGDGDPTTSTTLAALQADVATANGLLAGDIGANGTDATLQANLTAAQTAINAVPGLAAAIASYQLRADALTAAAAADDAADANLAGVVVEYETLNTVSLNNSIAVTGSGPTPGGVIDDGTNPLIIVNASGQIVLAAGVTEAVYPGVTELLAAVQAEAATERTEINATAAATAAANNVTTLDATAFGPGGTYTNLDAAQTAIENRADFVEAVAEAEALVAQAQALADALDAATDALEAAGVDNVFTVDTDVVATADSDFLVYVEDDATTVQTVFGFESEDALYVGKGYSVVNLAEGTDLGTTAQGNVAALELFIQQDGADAVIYIETETFQGTQTSGFAGEEIRFVGVNAADLSIDANGLITLGEVAVA